MVDKYYFDTCIWRDHYENRIGTGDRPLGDLASKLFIKFLREKKTILFSDFNSRELKQNYSDDEINDLFNLSFIAGKLQKVKINKEDVEEAHKLKLDRNISFGDCLHAVLARNNDAILVTQSNIIS